MSGLQIKFDIFAKCEWLSINQLQHITIIIYLKSIKHHDKTYCKISRYCP